MSSTDVNLSAAEARNYHLRSKHHMQRYAEGPGQLDWDAQPAPFRQFVGAPTLKLPFCAADQDRPFAELTQPHPAPAGRPSPAASFQRGSSAKMAPCARRSSADAAGK